jgi:hypothetical protein
MQHRKVWQLWSALTAHERRDFITWLASKLGERQQYVQKVGRYLQQRGLSCPDEAEVWQHLYPRTPFDDARLRKLLRDLSAWLEQYLSLKGFEADQSRQAYYLLQELTTRNRPDLFRKQHRRTRPSPDLELSQMLRFRYELAELWLRHEAIHDKLEPTQAQVARDRFDRWWSLERMQLAARNLTLNAEGAVDPLDTATADFLASHLANEERPELMLHLHLFQLVMRSAQRPQVEPVMAELRHWLTRIEGEPPESLFMLVLNQHLRAFVRSSEPEHARLAIEFSQLGLEMGWLLVNGSLPANNLRNLVNLCLQIPDLGLAERLLDDYLVLVPESQREEAEEFNRGNLAFAREAYPEVLRRLGEQRFSNAQYELQARSQVLMSHLALAETDPTWLAEQIAQLMRYLREQELSASFKASYHNQLRLLRRLALASDKKSLRQLLDEIETTRPLNRAAWLAQEAQARWRSLGR